MTRDEILAANDFRLVEKIIPGWGKVHLKEMSVEERETMISVLKELKDGSAEISEVSKLQKLYATTAALCLVDKKGNRLFTIDDISALMKKSQRSLFAVHTVALELSKATEPALDDAEKNSGAASTAGSFLN